MFSLKLCQENIHCGQEFDFWAVVLGKQALFTITKFCRKKGESHIGNRHQECKGYRINNMETKNNSQKKTLKKPFPYLYYIFCCIFDVTKVDIAIMCSTLFMARW